MEIDVALVPQVARPADPAVFVVIDEIRASTTITTLLDVGCAGLYIEGSVAAARRLGRDTGSLLVGERRAVRPPGFDFDNSPTILSRSNVRGRDVVLSTTNGTAILKLLRGSGDVLVGCLRNAGACASAAVDLAIGRGTGVRIVCAGRLRRFVLEDAIAGGVIARRVAGLAAARGIVATLTDGARAAMALRDAYPDELTALLDSDGARTLRSIGQEPDIGFCAEVDMSDTVPVLRDGDPLRIERLGA